MSARRKTAKKEAPAPEPVIEETADTPPTDRDGVASVLDQLVDRAPWWGDWGARDDALDAIETWRQGGDPLPDPPPDDAAPADA